MTRGGDFWSRRKAQVLEEEASELRAAEAAEIEVRAQALEEKTDEEICEELGLPDPGNLQPGDDVRAFMEKAVPDRLRRRALRKLWLSNPVLANVDGLVDYGEDFTDSATVIENLQTAYKVGKGMLKHVEEMARQAAAEGEPEPAVADVHVAKDTPDPEPAVNDDATADPPAFFAETATPEADEAPAILPRRRMQFSFDDHAGGAA